MDRFEVKFSTDDVDAKTGEFSGYGAVFGNIDSHGDVIAPAAFDETLAQWQAKGRWPSMRLMHGTALNPFAGEPLPIGVWKQMRIDGRGLHVTGKLSGLDTDFGRRIHGLVKDGALDGLSIGYKAARVGRPAAGSPAKRVLETIKLFEVSLVDEPSNDSARVVELKAAERVKTIREFEDFLRDVGGYSHSQAKAIAAHGFKGSEPRDEDGLSEAVAEALRRNIQLLTPKG